MLGATWTSWTTWLQDLPGMPWLGLACLAWTAFECGRLLTRRPGPRARDARGRPLAVEEVRERS